MAPTPTPAHRLLLAAATLSLLAAVAGGPTSLTVNGAPAVVGEYTFPSQASTVVFGNGLARLTFGRSGSTILLQSAIVNGTDLLNGASGNSYYIDSGGGSASLVCDHIKILRVSPSLVEAAWVDSHSPTLQHEHHLIMVPDVAGIYGYNILTAVQQTSISEVRLNSRWNRCILNRPFNHERGHDSQQLVYAYLYTQKQLQDETWMVDGKNNASLLCPDDNAGHYDAGEVYTKYIWSLYHHENSFFGHFGSGTNLNTTFGVFFTPLGGVTDQTSAASYGVGPNHQDLAIHQDALILNYFGPNHCEEWAAKMMLVNTGKRQYRY